jgi:hypothetical protein
MHSNRRSFYILRIPNLEDEFASLSPPLIITISVMTNIAYISHIIVINDGFFTMFLFCYRNEERNKISKSS